MRDERPPPHLYDGIKLLVDAEAPRDLPRNSIRAALIGDPRNDENLTCRSYTWRS